MSLTQQASALPIPALRRRTDRERGPVPVLVSPPLSSPVPPRDLVPTVFHEPWWLTVASQGRYQQVEVESGGRVVGRLPYMATKRFGMTHIAMPMLTHFLGPAIQEGTGGETARCLHRLSVTKDLIGQLPKASHIYVKHHRATLDTLAFQALGFRTVVQFTWEIAPAAPDILWRQMRDKTRNVIRRAEERLQVVDVSDATKFMTFYASNLRQKRETLNFNFDQSVRVLEESIRRHAGRMIVAQNEHGDWKSGIFTLRDRAVEYYLLSTRTADSGNGAVSLPIWNAIQGAAARGAIFDFDGISKESSALFFLGFGGQIRSRFVSHRTSMPAKILNHILRPRP